MYKQKYLTALLVVLSLFLVASLVVLATGKEENSGMYSAARIKRGEYLVVAGGCHDCHSPKLFTPNGPEPDPERLLSGFPEGTKLPPMPVDTIGPEKWGGIFSNDFTAWAGPWGVTFGINLTPDDQTGIGLWTEEIFINAIRTGKHMGAGRPILPPMPWFNYAKLSDDDLKSIFAYLRTLKPVRNLVPSPVQPQMVISN